MVRMDSGSKCTWNNSSRKRERSHSRGCWVMPTGGKMTGCSLTAQLLKGRQEAGEEFDMADWKANIDFLPSAPVCLWLDTTGEMFHSPDIARVCVCVWSLTYFTLTG